MDFDTINSRFLSMEQQLENVAKTFVPKKFKEIQQRISFLKRLETTLAAAEKSLNSYQVTEANRNIVDQYSKKVEAIREKITSLQIPGSRENTEQMPVKQSYDINKNQFDEDYTIDEYIGLSAGANGGVELVEVHDSENRTGRFAMKTAQPGILFMPEIYRQVLPDAACKGGPLDPDQTIGFQKCTMRERLRIFNLFGANEPNGTVHNIAELRKTIPDEAIRKYRKDIFGSETGGIKRMPDDHLRALAYFGKTALEDIREMGCFSESDIINEAEIYRHLRDETHQNVLNMVSFGSRSKDPDGAVGIYLVLELAQGTLNDYLEAHPIKNLDEAIEYSHQIVSALNFLVKHHIIHRDVKIDNFLVGFDGKAKISDLGTAKIAGKAGPTPGNPYAIPPDYDTAIHDEEKFDCWAVGFEILSLVAEKGQKGLIGALQDYLDPIKTSYQHALRQRTVADDELKKAAELLRKAEIAFATAKKTEKQETPDEKSAVLNAEKNLNDAKKKEQAAIAMQKAAINRETTEKNRIENLIRKGNDGVMSRECGVENIFPQPQGDNQKRLTQHKELTDIIVNLLKANPKERISLNDAMDRLNNLRWF